MGMTPATHHEQVIYQADGSSADVIRSIRHKMQHICRHYTNQTVKIQTLDGQIIVGRLVGCDNGLLQLAVRRQWQGAPRGFGSPYWGQDEVILTLVLYELLVITLLYT